MNAKTGKAITVAGKKVTAEKVFIPETANGTTTLTFTFDGSDMAGITTVVFEEVYIKVDANDDGIKESEEKVADHEDLTDEDQTVYIPKIGTQASLTKTGKIVDVVKYENLIPGQMYIMSGILMDKATGEPVIIDGKTVTATTRFSVTNPSGSIKMVFDFDYDALEGKTVVVFEELTLCIDTDGDGTYDKKEPIAKHKDIDDSNQTVDFPEKISDSKAPRTGDDNNIIPWAIALVVSASTGTVLVVRRRKQVTK